MRGTPTENFLLSYRGPGGPMDWKLGGLSVVNSAGDRCDQGLHFVNCS